MRKLILSLCLVVNVVIGVSSKSPITTLPAFVYGKEGAAIDVVEFCSMYCPACTYFKQRTFPLIEEQYIATGQVKWIRIPFPIDYGDILMLTYLKNVPDDQRKQLYEWYESFREETSFKDEDHFHEELWVGLTHNFPQLKCLKRVTYVEIDEILRETVRLAEQYTLKQYPTFLIDGECVSVSQIKQAIEQRLKREHT